VVAARLRVADTFWGRLMGLLGRSGLQADAGLLIRPCRVVHTIGMRFPIDLIYLDARNKVVKAEAVVSPLRICWGNDQTVSVMELSAGTIESSKTEPGDLFQLIEVTPQQQDSNGLRS